MHITCRDLELEKISSKMNSFMNISICIVINTIVHCKPTKTFAKHKIVFCELLINNRYIVSIWAYNMMHLSVKHSNPYCQMYFQIYNSSLQTFEDACKTTNSKNRQSTASRKSFKLFIRDHAVRFNPYLTTKVISLQQRPRF